MSHRGSEVAFLNQLGQAEIQSDLFYDFALDTASDEIAQLIREFVRDPPA